MTSSSNEQLPWDASEPKGTSAPTPAVRSSLSLGGGTAPIPSAPSATEAPRDLLADGATRARNMATALVMIVYLLAKYVAVKVVWSQLQTAGLRGFLVGSRLLQALYLVLQPHLARLRQQAKAHGNRAFRSFLIALIAVVGPAEELVIKVLGIAKVEAAKLAAKSTRSLRQVLASLGSAIAQAIRAGMTRPAVQKLAAKLIKILEDAQI